MVDSEMLIAAIKKAGYTIDAFAQKLGMSRSTLWRKIYGKGVFDLDEMNRIIDYLDIKEPRTIFLINKF